MKLRRILPISVVAVILSTLIFTNAFAYTGKITGFAEQAGFDTLSFAQSDYLPANASNNDPDKQAENTIKGFLASIKASIRKPGLYNGIYFIASEASSNNMLSEAQYQSALNETMGWEITSDNISFSNFNIKHENGSVKASIVEDYTYSITDGFNSESFRRREYFFTLAEGREGWEITDIKTNDPWVLD